MIDITADLIVNLNTDKYLNWLFSRKEVTEEDLIQRRALHSALLKSEGVPANKIKENDHFFINGDKRVKWWKKMPGDFYSQFKILRGLSFGQELNGYQSFFSESPLPPKYILETEFERMYLNMNKIFLQNIIYKVPIDDYTGLAFLIGQIDYLKYLNSPQIKINSNNINVNHPFKVQRKELAIKQIKGKSTVKFEDYLDDAGKKILPELIKEYEGARPLEYAYMICALIKCEIALPGIKSNLSQLYRALYEIFPLIGNGSGFRNNLSRLANPSFSQDEELEIHEGKINHLLASLKNPPAK
jgi:hypothetical protein